MASLKPKPFKLTAPKPFIPKEYDEQVSIFDEAKIRAKQDSRWALLFSTLNGVRLPIGLAVKMKKAGNKQGVPDLILPIPRNGFHGLFVELKRRNGVPSDLRDAQEWWFGVLLSFNYRVELAYGAKEAIAIIVRYLDE